MDFTKVYFIGIGGIGMSALARYFKHCGKEVAGYDRVSTPLTVQLEAEGMAVHYDDDTALIPQQFLDARDTLVIYTPAVPQDHSELGYFRANEFKTVKRSEILGVVAHGKYVMAVAGTHGKTTTSTMTAYFNAATGNGGSAFLGGISKNFDSNLVLGAGDRLTVEADEFDRSFLRLYPDVAVITAVDADHLDIYGTHEAVREAFSQFVSQIKPGGALVIKKGVDLEIRNKDIRVYTYSYDSPADFHAKNITTVEGGYSRFDVVCPDRTIQGCVCGVPGWVNVENAIAALSLLWCSGGFDDEAMRRAMRTFSGVRRRFDFYINTPRVVYMDDYAHHPQELTAALTSLRGIFPARRITAVFQPHLYTRTRDFAAEFADALSLADEVLLLPIYPARELPIEGVSSEIILDGITCSKKLIDKPQIIEEIEHSDIDVLVTFGAGDIDAYCEKIAECLRKKYGIEQGS